MFTLDTIFISITFLILSVILIKIKSSRVIILLTIIYVLFIFFKLSTTKYEIQSKEFKKTNETQSKEVQKSSKPDELGTQSQVQKPAIEEVIIGQKEKEDQKQLDVISSNKKEIVKKKKIEESKTIVKKDVQKKISNETKKKPILDNILTLKEIKICKNIKNRNPVGIGEIFPSSVDSLYCFTKIQNLGKKMEVRHVWYYENQIMTQVRYNVKKSKVYRSWTKKTISSFQIGNWRVEVQDRNGTIIGTKRFKIKKPS